METQIEKDKKNIKIGFVGTGWIGRSRMAGVLNEPFLQPVAIVDPDDAQALEAQSISSDSIRFDTLHDLLQRRPDAVVIATPSAMHAEQSVQALESGCAVFCQKPLGRNANECRRVIETAKRNDLSLGVDLSYRWIEGVRIARSIIKNNEIGTVFSVDCSFHNAYGPDKAWFYNREFSGGGCLIDLGTHLIDLSMWMLEFPIVKNITGALYWKGCRTNETSKSTVEDFAEARIELETGTIIKIASSWKISAGCNAVINWTFYGTNGTICIKNVNGSFYDFITEKYNGTSRIVLNRSPQDWGGVAIREWAKNLYKKNYFDREIEHVYEVASIIDSIYSSSN